MRVGRRWIALVLAAAALAACVRSQATGLGVAEVSKPLPALSGPTLQGGTFGPSDHVGKVLVVNFWATWCGPCRDEQPELQRVYHAFRERGVAFVGVDERDNAPAAKAWIDEFGVTYPSLEDPEGAYSDDFGFFGLPDTYVVDRSGVIRWAITGATSEEQLTGLIAELLDAEA